MSKSKQISDEILSLIGRKKFQEARNLLHQAKYMIDKNDLLELQVMVNSLNIKIIDDMNRKILGNSTVVSQVYKNESNAMKQSEIDAKRKKEEILNSISNGRRI